MQYQSVVLSEIDEEELTSAIAAGAAVVVRWPPEQQGCRAFTEAAEEVMGPYKISAGSESGWMGGGEKPSETKQRRAVYERPSCKESVFGKSSAHPISSTNHQMYQCSVRLE